MNGRSFGIQLLIFACSLAGSLVTVGFAFFSIQTPWLSLPVALFLVWLYILSRKKAVLAAAVLWLCYVPYEYGMKLRILCSGECNIRVDLLLIYPLLVCASCAAFAVFLSDQVAARAGGLHPR